MHPHTQTYILHVDDDEDTADMLCSLLGLINCQVTTAGTFDEALEQSRSQSFDLYLLDTWLPGGSGIELCRKIRETDSRTPVVFYSGAAYDSDRQEALAAGAQGYLVKPTDIDKLVETVKGLLRI
jgi:DNA-binding response OmpR family regulator